MNFELLLTDEKKEELERLAALGYRADEMAMYFGVDQKSFVEASKDQGSWIHYHIKRGQLISLAKEQMQILTEAETGNVTASQHLANLRRNRGWEVSKLDIFGAFDNKKLLDRLEDYLQSGNLNKINSEEAIYFDALMLMDGMGRKYGRRNTVRVFTSPPFNLTYSRASEMFDESQNLFYTDRNVTKKALRVKKAEQLEEAAIIVRDNAQTAKDWEVYSKIVMDSAKLRELDKPDPVQLPAELYIKPIRVYSLDTDAIGLSKIDRQQLASQIESLEIPEREKIRLRNDALIEPFNILETLHGLEEESKSEE